MGESQQKAVCDQHGAEFLPPVPGSRVGIAIETLGLQPLNGLRVDPEGGGCGWYLWGGGEPADADDFYKPLCVEHLVNHCPAALSFLALPPGWRFLTDGKYVDVWFDAALTKDRRRIKLSERDSHLVNDLLENPPPPNAKLRRAARDLLDRS